MNQQTFKICNNIIEEKEESDYTEETEEEDSEEEENKEISDEEETPQKNNIKNYSNNENNTNILNENIFIISLDLLKKFKEISPNDSDSILIDYLIRKGLPTYFKNIKILCLYLYFHKICSSYFNLFNKISSEEISDIILSLLKESYYIIADDERKHYNYIHISQKIFQNLRISKENSEISKIKIFLKDELTKNSKDIQINKLILELGFQSNGRLDVYVKIHIIKSIIKYLNKYFYKWRNARKME